MLSQKLTLAAAGNAAADRTYVDDVFSTFLYDGTGSAQTITNGIDLSGEGGMVWLKRRDSSTQYSVYDTARGRNAGFLRTDSSAAQFAMTGIYTTYGLTSFNNNGFSLGSALNNENDTNADHVGWTFRKCPGFFDIVTYTGDGSYARNISHNLGSVPGSVWVKRLSGNDDWVVYHRGTDSSSPQDYVTFLNEPYARSNNDLFADTAPTASVFTIGSNVKLNGNGETYVAYLFAHDEPVFGENGDQSIIKCGSYTGTGSDGNQITLGFEPQWVIIKKTSANGNWLMFDTMRGFTTAAEVDEYIHANTSAAASVHQYGGPTETGFQVEGSDGDANGNGASYIYIAIRRPHKPPETGTDVFAIDNKSPASTNTPQYTSNFPVDFLLNRFNVHATGGPSFRNRHANEYIQANENTARVSDSSNTTKFNYNNGYGDLTSSDSNDYVYMFRRAPEFADLVFYDGTGSNRTVTHNLAATPELMIVKRRDASGAWRVYSSGTGAGKYLRLDSNAAETTTSTRWNNTAPTSSVFTVGTASDVNSSSGSYVAFLFASLSGISKIGTYSGAGGSTDVDVDCGFTNGARFVIIKKINQVGDWNVFDTSRGINSGTEKYFTLNNSFAPYEFDVIDPLSSGFRVVNETAAAQGFNVSGHTYLFFAIA